ncbi:MAG: hypothetical protein M3464_02630, partial [Chloroflexota bacterium]|nr:hypothetical protein [Chloroflexota bacterium]
TVISFGLDQRDELVRFLQRELQAGDVVLLKGSRGLRMEEMVEVLRADAGLDRPGELTDPDGQTVAP